jgi:hypothetical protein
MNLCQFADFHVSLHRKVILLLFVYNKLHLPFKRKMWGKMSAPRGSYPAKGRGYRNKSQFSPLPLFSEMTAFFEEGAHLRMQLFGQIFNFGIDAVAELRVDLSQSRQTDLAFAPFARIKQLEQCLPYSARANTSCI